MSTPLHRRSRLLRDVNTQLGETQGKGTDCAQSKRAGSQLFFVESQGKNAVNRRLFVRHRYCRLLTCRTCGPDAFANLLDYLLAKVRDGTFKAVWTLTMRITDFSEDPLKHHKAFQAAFTRLKERVMYHIQKADRTARFRYFLSWASSGEGNLHAHVLVSHAMGPKLASMWKACQGGQQIDEAVLNPATAEKAVSYFNLKSLSEVCALFKAMGRKPYLNSQNLGIKRLPQAYGGPRHLRTTYGFLYGGRPYALQRTTKQLCRDLGLPQSSGDSTCLHQVELPPETDLALLNRLRPRFDFKGRGSLNLEDKSFNPVYAKYDPPGETNPEGVKYDAPALRRNVRSRMRHARELYVTSTRGGSSKYDFPPFVGAYDAGDRLVAYMRKNNLGNCVFLPRFSLLPVMEKVVQSGQALMIAVTWGKVYRIEPDAYEDLKSQKLLLSDYCIRDFGALYTDRIDLIVMASLAVDPQHQRVVLLDHFTTAAEMEMLIDEHPGVRLPIHGGRPRQPFTRIATVVADAQIFPHTEPWMRDDVEVDVAFTPTRTLTYASSSVGIRTRDGFPNLKPKFG